MGFLRRLFLTIASFRKADVLAIVSDQTYTGKYFLLSAKLNGRQVYPSWRITSGNQYATVNQNGRVDIAEGVQNQTITVRADYGNTTASAQMTVTYDNQLTIECSDTMTGTSGNAVAKYNSVVVTPTWSVTSGGSCMTVAADGSITLLASGTATLQAEYSGYTKTKNITVVYVPGSVTETTVDPDTGAVTTTTTTETTDPQTGETTTNSTSVTTNTDGSQSTTDTETVTNSDGSSTSQSSTSNSDGTSSESTTTTSGDHELQRGWRPDNWFQC